MGTPDENASLRRRISERLFPWLGAERKIFLSRIEQLESERDWLRAVLGKHLERRDEALHTKVQAKLNGDARNWNSYLRNNVGVSGEDQRVEYTPTGIKSLGDPNGGR